MVCVVLPSRTEKSSAMRCQSRPGSTVARNTWSPGLKDAEGMETWTAMEVGVVCHVWFQLRTAALHTPGGYRGVTRGSPVPGSVEAVVVTAVCKHPGRRELPAKVSGALPMPTVKVKGPAVMGMA